MGDRREYQDGSLEYLLLLDAFMDSFSRQVVEMGLETPLFHIFSETLLPCPSEDGFFDEFPTWPVKLDQVCAAFVSNQWPEFIFFIRLRPNQRRQIGGLLLAP